MVGLPRKPIKNEGSDEEARGTKQRGRNEEG
jgi:hypothetical protein